MVGANTSSATSRQGYLVRTMFLLKFPGCTITPLLRSQNSTKFNCVLLSLSPGLLVNSVVYGIFRDVSQNLYSITEARSILPRFTMVPAAALIFAALTAASGVGSFHRQRVLPVGSSSPSLPLPPIKQLHAAELAWLPQPGRST